jgi:gluconate 2-dehydrogenase gamma chain
MSADDTSRRQFLVSSLTGVSTAWIALNWPALVQAQQMAHQGAGFVFFTPAQAAEIEAMSAQIFPSDDTPGAREAHVVYFIDRSLSTFAQDAQPVYVQGIQDLHAKSKELVPSATAFSTLGAAQQVQVLTAIETTPFFKTVRDHTIMGMFASPQHGGNANKVGWKLIGFEDTLAFKPPFGYYDR